MSDDTMRCERCDTDHDDWSKDGEHTINSKHHAGVATRWECGLCGNVVGVLRR